MLGRNRLALLALPALLLAACQSPTVPDPDPDPVNVQGVTVTAPSTDVGIGATLQLTATVTPAGATPDVTWSSSDDTRLTVNATGLATAELAPLATGTVTVTATSTENTGISGSVDLTIVCGALTAAAVSSGGTLPEDTCYIAESALSVTDGTLVLEPGVEISFGTNGSLRIGSAGRLTAIGTMDKGITLTSVDPIGSWRGVRFDDSRGAENVLHYVTIENGGSDGWSGASYSAAGLLLTGNSLIDIRYSTIRGSAASGVTLYQDAEMDFYENVLSENAYAAWMHPEAVQYLDAESTIQDNTEDLVRVGFGNNDAVSSAQSWFDTGVPYELQDRMFIDAALDVRPGVTIQARAGSSIIVRNEGSLAAVGEPLSPITFEGSEDERGAWKGIQIQTQSNDNVFDYVTFANGGSEQWTGAGDSRAMVYLDGNSSALFLRTTFRDSEHYGLWVPAGGDISGWDENSFVGNARAMIVHPDRASSITSNTVFTDNDENAVRMTFGNNDRVNANQTWNALSVPYRVMDRTFIEADLSIAAGAVFEFTQGANFVVTGEGTLSATGTAVDRIVFRGTEALSGYWKGIEYNTVSVLNRLDYVDFLHGGSDPWSGGANATASLHITGDGLAVLDNVTFAMTGGYAAIRRWEGSLTCTNTDDGGFQIYVYEPGNNRAQATCPG